MEKIDWSQVGRLVVAGVAGGIITLVGWAWLGGSSGGNSNSGVDSSISVEENSATISAVSKTLPSVVAIVSKQNVRSIFGGVYEATGGGSGFVVRKDGLIVTNKHVVDSDTAKYTVVTADGKSYDAKVVAKDPVADLALVKISATNLPIVELGDSSKLALGQRVIAIGNALGEYQNTVTTGVVSGIGRSITAGTGLGGSEKLENVIQTDAAINPGNSGGPLLNLAGQVIGINTAIDSQGESVGFAIPINSVKTQIQTVAGGGEIVRPYLGVRYILITSELAAINNLDTKEGALITKGSSGEAAVQSGSPAAKAGIRESDVIISINDKKITEDLSLSTILQDCNPGDVVNIKLVRDKKEQTITATLGKL